MDDDRGLPVAGLAVDLLGDALSVTLDVERAVGAQLGVPHFEFRAHSASTLWTSCTQIDPSPTAEATRLTLPERTSPTANTPGLLVSRRCGGRASGHFARSVPVSSEPVLTKPFS